MNLQDALLMVSVKKRFIVPEDWPRKIILNSMVIRIVILFAISILASSKHNQPQPRTTKEAGQPTIHLQNPDPHFDMRQLQSKKKQQVRLDGQVFQDVSFLVTNTTQQFFVIPDLQEEIRITFDVFWKQNNVYLLANIQDKQQITVTVNDRVRNIVVQETFYTATGIKFNGVAKQKYQIRINNGGDIEKLLFMRVSQKIKTPETAAKKSEMIALRRKLVFADAKLKNALADTTMGYVLDRQISSYVLHQSTAYSHFQIFESILVVVISCVEVIFVRRLLKTDIIV